MLKRRYCVVNRCKKGKISVKLILVAVPKFFVFSTRVSTFNQTRGYFITHLSNRIGLLSSSSIDPSDIGIPFALNAECESKI